MLGKNKTIHARKCVVREVTKAEADSFFLDNHIQGTCVFKVGYGLEFEGKIVAMMTFGKSRYNRTFDWELLRYANIKYFSVVGGASKLLTYFVKHNQWNNIVSYCDLRWNTGMMYEKIGFVHLRNTGPNYWYVFKHSTIESRVRYQKHKLARVLDKFDPLLTEWENMQINGFDRFWDCGSSVYVLENPVG